MFLIKRKDGKQVNFDAAEFVETDGIDTTITLSGNQFVYLRGVLPGHIWQEKRRENFSLKAEWETQSEVLMNMPMSRD